MKTLGNKSLFCLKFKWCDCQATATMICLQNYVIPCKNKRGVYRQNSDPVESRTFDHLILLLKLYFIRMKPFLNLIFSKYILHVEPVRSCILTSKVLFALFFDKEFFLNVSPIPLITALLLSIMNGCFLQCDCCSC